MWTKFWDMASGGSHKEKWDHIYIESAEEEAKIIFFNRFKHNPERVSCTCCGEDYGIYEYRTLKEASAFDRGCAYDAENKCYLEEPTESGYKDYQSLEDYMKNEKVMIIFAADITPEEQEGKVPVQGYVWVN